MNSCPINVCCPFSGDGSFVQNPSDSLIPLVEFSSAPIDINDIPSADSPFTLNDNIRRLLVERNRLNNSMPRGRTKGK